MTHSSAVSLGVIATGALGILLSAGLLAMLLWIFALGVSVWLYGRESSRGQG